MNDYVIDEAEEPCSLAQLIADNADCPLDAEQVAALEALKVGEFYYMNMGAHGVFRIVAIDGDEPDPCREFTINGIGPADLFSVMLYAFERDRREVMTALQRLVVGESIEFAVLHEHTISVTATVDALSRIENGS